MKEAEGKQADEPRETRVEAARGRGTRGEGRRRRDATRKRARRGGRVEQPSRAGGRERDRGGARQRRSDSRSGFASRQSPAGRGARVKGRWAFAKQACAPGRLPAPLQTPRRSLSLSPSLSFWRAARMFRAACDICDSSVGLGKWRQASNDDSFCSQKNQNPDSGATQPRNQV